MDTDASQEALGVDDDARLEEDETPEIDDEEPEDDNEDDDDDDEEPAVVGGLFDNIKPHRVSAPVLKGNEMAKAQPKRRGRPPKAKTENAPAKRRGRPPLSASEKAARAAAKEKTPAKRRGRPPKAQTSAKPAKAKPVRAEGAVTHLLGLVTSGSYTLAQLEAGVEGLKALAAKLR